MYVPEGIVGALLRGCLSVTAGVCLNMVSLWPQILLISQICGGENWQSDPLVSKQPETTSARARCPQKQGKMAAAAAKSVSCCVQKLSARKAPVPLLRVRAIAQPRRSSLHTMNILGGLFGGEVRASVQKCGAANDMMACLLL